MQLIENQPLAPYTTFRIGGPARWFAHAEREDDITEACAWAREQNAPLFVLGGGSNVLVSDEGFEGLVVHIALTHIAWDGDVLRAGAGSIWDDCVEQATKAGCAGIECLAGIPGTVGGTPVQNVGAYGQEVSEVIECVRAFDIERQEFVEFSAAECEFEYRRSRFNSTDRGRFIVTRVDYRLRRGGSPNLSYTDVKLHFQNRPNSPSLTEVAAGVREIRRNKGMLLVDGDPDCRSAGSFFKNPAVPRLVAARIQQFAADAGVPLQVYPAAGGLVKIPAAWLIEQAGFAKGYALGAARISSRHTLALINFGDTRGGASADEILALADEIAGAVEDEFGVRLEMEPEKVGFGSEAVSQPRPQRSVTQR
jgi:UDP-N-acetylmuramate dehydrogenase